MRKKWEYIGKREILRRVSALGYPVASGKLCSYSKFEGVEWVESAKIKITAQRGGDWLQITQKLESITNTYIRYDGKNYLDKW
jgi:hypothetical protein|nr:MAG TPA: RNA transcription, translation and transport factor protein [Caudoviricetes sp.]